MASDADIRSVVTEVIERFFHLVSRRDMQVVDEFAPRHDVMLVGSEAGEIATGQSGIREFFTRLYARPSTFSWRTRNVSVGREGDVAWFFAEGQMHVGDASSQRPVPYRIGGVLERVDDRWLWRLYHGSEPAATD